MRRLASSALVLLLTTTAAAQPSLTPERSPPPPIEDRPTRSVATAYTLVAGGLALGVGLVAIDDDEEVAVSFGALTILAAPSFGHWYAGGRILTPGLVTRGLAIPAFYVGLLEAMDDLFETREESDGNDGSGFIVLGWGLLVGGTIWDLATTPGVVADANRRAFALTPIAIRDGDALRPGFGVAGAF